MGRLDGKVMIVTGSGSGFGRGREKYHADNAPISCLKIVQKALSEGALVLGIDINQPGNDATLDSLPTTLSQNFCPFTGSVSHEQTWRDALQMSREKFSALPDTVVNCAGYVHLGADAHAVPEDDFDRVWQVNVKPLYLTVKVVVPCWIAGKVAGHVINIGSIGSRRPRASTIWYTASKGALDTVRAYQLLSFLVRSLSSPTVFFETQVVLDG
ncbi:hypothetical protein Z517_06627 [Fonsecaea pedrosoi CBS 271.37]|uniref:Uncharacterized protein n=1 Tax=Fonsecaea pedrosoi CBS 271.37 TaxID=1442368 RepID=A0A0D2F0B1_9EURO|nr:uncharacterized protein Z517_06627 [Fonsecaea pedrosoi CBS 271.37]KIW80012.1 hypothetical protein Z517_06627 [Fonsecaea pedrosoi CBS 271.37]